MLTTPFFRTCVLCVALTSTIGAQQSSERGPSGSADLRARGDTAIVHRDWRTITKLYEPVTKADPQNGMAWFRLGAARLELGQYAAAVTALSRAARLKFQPGQTELRL